MMSIFLLLLDESGSMNVSKNEVINSFNNFICDQKKVVNDNAKIYLLTFNNFVNTLHSGIPLEEVPLLTEQSYIPHGFTALYDAIAEGVNQVDKIISKEDRVICVLITDGEENSSVKTTLTDVKKIIIDHETNNNWTFVYIGKNPDNWKDTIGTKSNNLISYDTPDSISKSSTPIVNFRNSQKTKSFDIFK